MENKVLFEKLESTAKGLGANNARVIKADLIELDRVFRDICASNSCGVYGKCWMCPPDVGDIDELMREVRSFEYVLVYQQISDIEDSFDFEGMSDAKRKHYRLAQSIRDAIDPKDFSKILHLGCGGCGVCKVCAKRSGEPCRFPELAMASLEAYGIHVSKLAASSGMKYINGVNTVTYFGAVLFNL